MEGRTSASVGWILGMYILRVHVFILVLLPACVHGEQVGWRSWTRWTKRWPGRGSSNNLIISLRKVNERMKEFFFYFCRVCELLTSSEFNYLYSVTADSSSSSSSSSIFKSRQSLQYRRISGEVMEITINHGRRHHR